MDGVAYVEKLVQLIGRAFYSDEHVVVLRALVREKFLKDDEMGNAVNLQTRQVRKIMNELNEDHLVCEEVLNDKRVGGSSSTSYWYIDYKYFVEVVQYRLYVMQEHLTERENQEIERQTYQCKDPDCGREYTALEAQLLLMPGQHEFRCGHCNEILLECDNNDRLEVVQSLQRKLKDQMNKQPGVHDGIYEVLRGISDFLKEGNTLPSNLPSENRAAGIGGMSTRAGEAANGNGGGRVGGNGGNQGGHDGIGENAESYLYPYGQEAEIVVDIAGNDGGEDEYLSGTKRKLEQTDNGRPPKIPNSLPEFLQGSSLSGHLTAKHAHQDSSLPMKANISDTRAMMDPSGESSMTEEQRKEAFKVAYLAELERYNSENQDTEEVQVKVDKDGWEAEMNGDEEDEDQEDIEWEWCDDYENHITDTEITVQGKLKKLDTIDDDDLCKMTEREFMECYRLCRSQ